MNWIVTALSLVSGTLMQYAHQTNKVANSSFPVVKPSEKVSIVIPAFNEETFIEHVLLDVQNQNIIQAFPELFEIIVVDNQSTDATAEIASCYAHVVSAARGVLNARDKGIQVAEGEIIVFLDADNRVEVNYLNLLLRHFHNPDVVAVGGSMFFCHNTFGDILRNIFQVQSNIYNQIFRYHLPGGVCAFRKNAYYKIGGFDFSINQFDRGALWAESEQNFMSKLKQVGKVLVDPEATLWVEPRSYWCSHPLDVNCSSLQCVYCREVMEKQRF